MSFVFNTHAKKTISTFAYILAGWLLFVVIDVLKKSLHTRASANFIIYYYLPSFILWLLFTYVILYIFRWSSRFGTGARIVCLVLAGAAVGALKNVSTWLISYFLKKLFLNGTVSIQDDFINRMVSFYFIEAIIISWVVLALLYILELNKKYREKSLEALKLESQLTNAQLQMLKMQLHPHFLFNAHNTVAMLIRNKSHDKAVYMLSTLSDLLRSSLMNNMENKVTVKKELSILRKFLEIESIRFEDNLNIEISTDKESEDYLIPTLLLQPIVENAFKHGINKHLGNAILKIKLEVFSGHLIISIYNTGPEITGPLKRLRKNGIGIENTLSRLDKLYDKHHSFHIRNIDGGVEVQIKIPLEKA